MSLKPLGARQGATSRSWTIKYTLTASTGITLVVWRDAEMFHARRADEVTEPQICLGVDLFEVIAELAGLDLDTSSDASEAIRLADAAQRHLRANDGDGTAGDDEDSEEDPEEDWSRLS
jgi:hypothetical protein